MEKRKLFTKVTSLLLTLVMIVTMLPTLAVTTKAETGTVKVYFKLPTGASASDWGVNVWGGATATGNDNVKVRPSAWGDGDGYPTMLTDDDHEDWGYVEISGTVAGLQFVSLNEVVENCWNAAISSNGYTEAFYDKSTGKWYTSADLSTEIKELEVKDIYILAGAEGLAGSNWNQLDTGNQLTQVGDTTKYSITYNNVSAGTYEYKILQDPEVKGWDLVIGPGSGNQSITVEAPSNVTITIDTADKSAAHQVVIDMQEAIVVDNGSISKGTSKELATTAKYYDGKSVTSQEVTITYSLKDENKDVTLEGNSLTVSKGYTADSVVVIASYNGFSEELTIPVVSKQYKVTINMYSQDLTMEPGVSDVYIFENGGNNNTVVEMTDTVTDEENGITWVSGTVTLSYNSLGIIARDQAGTWNGGQDGNQYYVIPEDTTDEITLWYVYGKTPVTEKPVVTSEDPRYFYLEYTNDSLGENVVPQFYSWTTGNAAKLIDFEKQENGNWLVKVPVKSTCTKVDFVIALDATGDPWIKDGGDHSISFPLEQNVVCAKMKEGEEPELSAPYNVGYELQPQDGKITFYYRDDNALIDGTLSTLSPTIDIDGTEYEMTYVEADKRFEYVKNDLADGRMHYRYHVVATQNSEDTAFGEENSVDAGNNTEAAETDDEEVVEYVLDKFNENAEQVNGVDYSYVDYYNLVAEITAEVMNPSFNYNENDVVKFTVNQTEESKAKAELQIEKATIDVSSLGGSSALAIEPELQAVTISVTTDTELGKKELPITVTDQYGNVYETSVEVEVVARTKDSSKADDFDWDEACIYFMVTDRFFDGNEANNTASDSLLSEDASVSSTYGENEGLYHGGDFAGVTAKLDYLQDLGINTIWITPIVENIAGVNVGTDNHGDDVPYNAAYHGYWASDFTKLNPTLGTEEEFATMISEAHKRGIKIMVDIVVNHAGYDTEETFGDMLRSDEDVISGDDQKDSLSNLPDFKTEDADVRAQLVKWQTQWMTDYDIDYYRVDTVKHVEGTTWAALKNSVTEVNPSFKMIGEYSGAGYASNGGSLGSGEMDSDLDFDFNDQATNFVTGNISSVESFMTARNAALNNTYLTGQFLGSHDEDGFKYNLINGKSMTEEEATAASLVAATLQITAKGQPVIYYGEEIGLTGANNYPYQTNRYDFDWKLVSDDNVTYQHYKKLLAIRKAYVDVFARGTRQVIASDDEKGYDVVQRSYGDENLIVAMNIKDEVNTVTLEGYTANKTYKDLYSGNTLTADKDGKLTVTIPKSSEGGTVILVAEQVEVNEPAEEQKPTGDKTQTEDKTSTDKETTTTVSDNSSDTKEEKVTSISISSKSSKKIAAGKKTTLTVDVSPETAANKDVTWSSSNTKYATVNSKGVVTTKKKGAGKTVTITATAKDGSGVKATYKITIMKNAVKSIKLTASKKKVKAGSKVTLKAAVKTTGKNANKTLTWSSSNTKYATVSKKGVVTIKKAGKGKSVKITAKATDGSGKKATIKIKISK